MKNKQEQPSLIELVRLLIFREGWDRKLTADQMGQLVRVRSRPQADDSSLASMGGDFSETDIVGLYQEQDFLNGQLTLQAIKFDCRNFLLK